MAGHIAQGTGSEIPPTAPVPGGIYFVVRTEFCRPDKKIPVQGIRNTHFVSWPFQSLRPDGAVSPRINRNYFANSSGPNPFTGFADSFSGIALISHLSGNVVTQSRFGQYSRFKNRMSEWFLKVNMQAGFHRH